jgi:hypothetical protein
VHSFVVKFGVLVGVVNVEKHVIPQTALLADAARARLERKRYVENQVLGAACRR